MIPLATCPYALYPVRRLSGFTLIEILVALVISLLGALAIMQIYVGSEAGKRATGSLAEAQSGGLVAVFAIERDVQQAGMGFMNLATLGCNVRSNLGSSFDGRPLQPVSIVPAGAAINHASNLWGIPPGDADSDMIAIATGDGSAMVEGALLSVAAPAVSTDFRLSNALSIQTGDYLLLGEAGKDCTFTKALTANVNGDVTVDFGSAAAYAINSVAMHLGRTPQLVVYAVRNGTLTRCDFLVSNCANAGSTSDTTVWVPVANDVVALVAQYGVDISVPSDLTADVYCKSRVTAGGACPSPDTGLTAPGNTSLAQSARACDWARIPVVQLALVSRSGQYEKEEVSPATLKLWPDSAVAPTTTGPDWSVADRHYRYRVTRSAVALRNVIWMGAQSSC
jgi:type IV pilus assembly protein PilW